MQTGVNTLIESIYEAPLAKHGWRKALLGIADRYAATDAAIYTSDASGTSLSHAVSGRTPESVHDEYFETYMPLDTQIVRLLQLNRDTEITGHDLLEEPDFACPVHHEYLIPHGISSQIVWLLKDTGRISHTFVLMRDEKKGAFPDRVRSEFGLLARHVKRSIRLDTALGEARRESAGADTVLSISGIGILAWTVRGELLPRNAFAQTALTSSPSLRDALAALIKEAVVLLSSSDAPPFSQASCFDRTLKAPFEAIIHRLPDTSVPFGNARQAKFICMFRQQSDTNKRVWRQQFGLTGAEADLAEFLCAGGSLQAFAKRRGRSIHTVRNQLKTLMSKTDTCRQGQLVAKLRG